MSFFTYVYQLKVNLKKYLYVNKSIYPKLEKSKHVEEVNAIFRDDLALKCKKAVKEVQYIKSFTHWPITETEKTSEKSAIIYLDLSRKKRTTVTQEHDSSVIETSDKASVANKVTVIKNSVR